MEKKKINIVEVGPRDGFQSVKGDFIPTELKKDIIDLLVEAGVKHLEYSSFVSPKPFLSWRMRRMLRNMS